MGFWILEFVLRFRADWVRLLAVQSETFARLFARLGVTDRLAGEAAAAGLGFVAGANVGANATQFPASFQAIAIGIQAFFIGRAIEHFSLDAVSRHLCFGSVGTVACGYALA